MWDKLLVKMQKLTIYDILIIVFSTLFVVALIGVAYTAIKEAKRTFNKRKQKGFLLKSYRVFSNWSLTKRYVEQMRRRYEILYPEDAQSLQFKAMLISYIIWGISIVLIILLFGLRPSVYTAYLCVLSIVVLNNEILGFIVDNLSNKLREQFDKFLSDIRHCFYRHGMIDLAITQASELSERIMKVNADKMLTVLESSDKESAMRLYNETVSDRFLRMFLSFAVYVAEFGDKVVNNVSTLSLNVNILKSDLYIEKMNTTETSFKFSGLIFISVAPVYVLDVIKNWTIGVAPQLMSFYDGVLGVATRISVYFTTVIAYVMVNELKGRNEPGTKENYFIKGLSRTKFIKRILSNYEEKNRLKLEKTEYLLYRVGEKLTAKQFFLKRMLYAIALFFICIMLSVSVHRDNRINLTTSQAFLIDDPGVIPDRYVDKAIEVVLRYVNNYKKVNIERADLEKELKAEGLFRSETVFNGVVDEIVLRIDAYQKEYFHWYELLFSIFIAGIAYWFPYWMLLYRRHVLYLNMGNEVSLFQSSILMVKDLNNTTVLKILGIMETHAIIFKESIKNCMNDYLSGDLDALEKLKIREKYEPFRRLVDNLIIADKIGIPKAFDEILEERKINQEMRNQDYRIIREKKYILALIIAAIPAVITVALYWIIPFSVSALEGLGKYDELMNSIR